MPARMNPGLANRLPRLLYISDVPVEKSYHGSLLLYRLLEHYPADKLMVIESNLFPSEDVRRLKGVAYRRLWLGPGRLQRTRFSKWFAAGLTLTGAWRVGGVKRLLNGFQAQAVLSVTYFYLWVTAAAFAARLKIPLHLIHHDECVETPLLPFRTKPKTHRMFEKAYRQAASRFCVSPYMADYYEQRYGVRGSVLYPSRGSDACVFDAPPERLGFNLNGHGLTVAFGGTINSVGQMRQVKAVSDAVGRIGGTVHLFGPMDAVRCRTQGLEGSHLRFRGLLSPDNFRDRLREEADVLMVPMNDDENDAMNAKISFPSKLTEYTAVGLPLLIIGPEYCSAVRWAGENPGVAEVVTEADPAKVELALRRLMDPRHRVRLAEIALTKGNQYFSYTTALNLFYGGLVAR